MNPKEAFYVLQDYLKPTISLIVNGKRMTFLCDSGACKTVIIKDEEPPGTLYSKNSITVKSATGHTNVEFLTKPLKFQEPISNVCCEEQVLVSATCPVNLLGRDIMRGLRIGIIPTTQGMKAIRLSRGTTETTEILVQEGAGEPHYYYTIDLAKNGPTSVVEDLVREVRERITPEAVLHAPDELHCTLWFKYTTGSDKKYETKLLKERYSTLHLTNLYWDQQGNAAVAVRLAKKDYELFRGYPSRPHVSVSKRQGGRWRYLGELVAKGEAEKNWTLVDEKAQVYYSKRAGLYTRALNWTTRGTKGVHLADGGR